jgi:hypothetical protein
VILVVVHDIPEVQEKAGLIGWVWPIEVHPHCPNDFPEIFVESDAGIAD